jgi:hypothetical protein
MDGIIFLCIGHLIQKDLKEMNREELNQLLSLVEKWHKEIKYNEACSDDRTGLQSMKLGIALKYYKMGYDHEVPTEWQKLLDQQDPLYKEYLRLKRKFG